MLSINLKPKKHVCAFCRKKLHWSQEFCNRGCEREYRRRCVPHKHKTASENGARTFFRNC